MTSRSPKPKSTEAGEALKASLAQRGLSQYAAAKAAGASQGFLNQVVNGERLPSAEWLEVIATALKMKPQERARLHRAAARAHGFKIDLT
jgi:transcriptional regulator with XRE-family HTH domain